MGISWRERGGWWCGCNSKQVALPSQIGATELLYHQQVWPSVGEVTEIGTDVEARKRGHSPEQQPTTILLVEPPPALLLLQPPQQPTHSLLAKEASVSNQGLNSEIGLFSEGESETKEAGAQHSLKLG